jgi:tetratricopeptide (TPR) repeat protein
VEFAVDDHVWQYLRLRLDTDTSAAKRWARRQALEDARNARGRRTDTVHRLNETIQVWRDAGKLGEALEAARDAVAATHLSGERPAEALALATLADLQADIGNIEEASALAEAACEVNGAAAPARALRCLGRVARQRGQADEGERKLEQALAAARQGRDAAEEARVVIEQALTFAHTDPARSIAAADEAFALCQHYQGRAAILWASLLTGASFARSNALLACGRAQEASDCLTEAARRASDDQALWLAWLSWLLGTAALALDERDERHAAIEASAEAIERFSAMSHHYGAGWSRLLLGRVYAGSDRLDEAVTSVSDALQTFQNCGDRLAEDEARRALSLLLRRRGHELQDPNDLEEAARIFQDLGDHANLAEVRVELAAAWPDQPVRRWKPSLRWRRR